MGDGNRTDNREYYDAFAARYELHRGERSRGGYHDLVDELESEFVRRFASGKDVLEVGCGTGLILQRLDAFARSTCGVDLSPNMLELARRRQLNVQLGSATRLPFRDGSFDVACAFKVLAHVREVRLALSEMARVVRPGGHVIAEFYNPWSLRAVVKRLCPPRQVAEGISEANVFTRYDSPTAVRSLVPMGCQLVASRGVRIVIPSAGVMQWPVARSLFRFAEQRLCESRLAPFGGFWIAAFQVAAKPTL
jgi:ubiquinone/menaquinone biosynthesis C-methylase UbiE